MLAFGLFATFASAQAQTGTPPFGSFGGGPDVVNLANLNVRLTIPVVTKPGQETNFEHELTLDSLVWYPIKTDGLTKWQKIKNWGWASDGMFNGSTVPRISAMNPVDFTYTAPHRDRSGNIASVAVTYAPYTVKTNFGCLISDYTTTTHSLIDRVTLPDGAFYRFGYERTPDYPASITGRVASVTFPSGETISYEYSGGGPGVNGITCADGSAASLTRTTAEGGWKYEHIKVTATESTTTITDPKGNQTFVRFNGVYETARDVYQGSIASGNLLKSVYTCYSSTLVPPCVKDSIRLPIAFRSITTRPSSGQTTRHTETFDTTYGLPTQIDEYDDGLEQYGRLVERAQIEYETSPELVKNGIVDRPRRITILDGSLATKAVIEYYCGQGDLAAPVDLRFGSDAATGGRGNPMTIRLPKYSLVMDKNPNELPVPPTVWDFLGRVMRTSVNGKTATIGCTH